MTRKHFNLLAGALWAVRPKPPISGTMIHGALTVQWQADCEAVADVCQKANANFNRDRFLSACGIED